MVAAASRLAALPIEGEPPIAVERRRARELLQTTLVQQQAYSYSCERIHYTPRPSRSYNRHIDEPAVSSSERNRNPACGHNPAGGTDAQNMVDQGRARREAELAAQYVARQPTPVRATTSMEPGVAFSSLVCRVSPRLYVMCVCPRTSRVLVKCPITLLTYPPSHGSKAMRWRWRCWMWMMRRVLNTSP